MDDSMGLFAVFCEAVRESPKGQQRTQWLLVPPSVADLGCEMPEGRARFLKRKIERTGHRAKWEQKEKPSFSLLASILKGELDQYASTGWDIRQPVTIRLEHDDYLKVMAPGSFETPYKALRHVEAVTKKAGYRLVN